MNKNLKIIYSVIQDSDLEQEQKLELFRLFKLPDDESLVEVAKLLAIKPKYIQLIYDNYKNKEQALRNDNLSALQDIIEQEKKLIEEV